VSPTSRPIADSDLPSSRSRRISGSIGGRDCGRFFRWPSRSWRASSSVESNTRRKLFVRKAGPGEIAARNGSWKVDHQLITWGGRIVTPRRDQDLHMPAWYMPPPCPDALS
jgi:hypothetical protein